VRSVDKHASGSVHLTDYPKADLSLVDEKLSTSIELVMKVRNDTDETRSRRYRSIPVHLSKEVELSQSKMNMIKDTFGRVETVD
jgi:hypothetical protein